ncbi:MAG TPA: GNAT family protein [Trueperaceae bacterium]
MMESCHKLDDLAVLLREAVPGDAGTLLDYIEQVSGETENLTFGPGEFGLGVREEAEYLRACHAQENSVYLLALHQEQIIGSINFAAGRRPRVRHSGELGMSVRQPYWGLGVGSLLLDALTAWARQTGVITKLNLRVRTDNERAIRLYQRKGFVREGTLRREMLVGGRYCDLYWMGLVLS